MPNLKASIKSLKQTKTRTDVNSRIKRRFRNAIKKYDNEIEAGNLDAASKELPRVYKLLDNAAKKGIIKSQTSARKKSRLAKKLNTASADVKTAKATA